MEFRERLYQLRKGRGISQEELANAVGVSRQAVQKWEAGASTPDLNNLSALADFFGVTLDYLVRGVEPEAPQAAPAERTVIHNYFTPYHYEYRSKCTLLGLPLVHIHLGSGPRRARGIIAIGNVATGLVAIGGFSAGLLSIGGLGSRFVESIGNRDYPVIMAATIVLAALIALFSLVSDLLCRALDPRVGLA